MWNAQHSCRELCQNSKSQFISSFHMWNLLPILVNWYPNRDHNTGVIIMLKRSFYVSGRVPHIIPSQFFIQCTPFMVIQHTRKSICQYCEHFTTHCNLLQRVQKKSVDSPINHLFVRRLKQVIQIRRKRIFRRLGIPGNIFTLFNLSVDIFATDIHVRRQCITPEHLLSAKFYTGVPIWVCKRVEFVIRFVNNLNTAR